ncbi:ABC transporter permease [Psychromicrobium xiongbiense]|uniref:ABC transporter permease n=1 Tax=Psychromicrobium xiongbiense TaxID=3051184 RepID=UPI0025535CB8|nr:ABC transporter permease [Psychromicrobium sp. YIM S02556]
MTAHKTALRQELGRLGIAPTRITWRDLIQESWLSVTRHMVRSLLTLTGTFLGCAAFIATLGLTGTVSNQVSSTFDARRATEVTVTEPSTISADPTADRPWFSPQAAAKVATLSGVEASGRVSKTSSVSVKRLLFQTESPVLVDVFGMDEGAVTATQPTLAQGRTFDVGHNTRGDFVVMLSQAVATKLGIAGVGSAIFMGDRGFTVIGIYQDTQRMPELSGGIILPLNTVTKYGLFDGQGLNRGYLIQTAPGAAAQVGAQVPLAISPQNVNAVMVTAPPDLKSLRQQVESGVTSLSLLVSLVALIVGAVSIGNSAATGVVTRAPEIGLRRALGARGIDIFGQLLGETAALGTFGGLLGSLVGLVVVVAVSAANRWAPVLDPWSIPLAIGFGTAAGAIAGLWPALKATRITPAQALAR